MKESRSLQFALHNEEACKYLEKSGQFIDWVITTAYYSAIHYIHHRIFPYTYIFPDGSKISYTDFDRLFKQFSKSNYSKHGFLRNFVEANHPAITIDFQHLMDNCFTARYNDYHFDAAAGISALNRLEKIKQYCLKD
jgi:hypothetical protein